MRAPVRAAARPLLAAAAALALAAAAQASAPPSPAARAVMTASPAEWHFEVQLDGKPVGEHRFSLSTEGSERRLRSTASFDVKLLGITVYRYRHDARERWKGDCLAELEARTDANGKPTTVSARLEPEGLRLSAPPGMATLPACTMTFAYWHPALRRQTQLLNPQTGRNVAVQMVPVGTGMIDVRGGAVQAEHWRLTGDESPIELWYTTGGEWLALDATVNGRRLSYRLR